MKGFLFLSHGAFSFLLVAVMLLTGCATVHVAEFEEWAKSPSGSLVEQPFAVKGLNRDECRQAAFVVDSLWMQSVAERLGRSWSRMMISDDSLRLLCAVRTFGNFPADGRSLYISMHGGGNCPKEVNDEQWYNQIYLYEPSEGVYVAPRAPWNTSDLWHRKGLDALLEELIQACVVFEGVNPNKVYLLGYSAGGDGVWRMAPRMADKWAAASMMAGHPGEASQVNLYNLPFMIWMGEHDHYYDRNLLAKEKGAVMDSLSTANPGKYIHQTHIVADKGHWMDRVDTLALDWMSQYRRNPYPKRVVWRQEAVIRETFYWLAAPADEVEHGKSAVVSVDGNVITIEQCDYSALTLYLNDSLVDLDKKVVVRYKGKVIANKRLQRTIANMYGALNERNDRSFAFPAVLHVELCK